MGSFKLHGVTGDNAYYVALAEIAFNVEPDVIYDIGTRSGESANALLPHARESIYTFDITEDSGWTIVRPEIQIVIGNMLEDESLYTQDDPDLIFLDVDPHDGEKEREFVKLFERHAKPGKPIFVIFDDIRFNEGMRDFWSWLSLRPNWLISDISDLALREQPGFGLGRYCK